MLEQILSLDRDITLFINGSHSLLWDQVIYVATSTVAWLPLGVVLLWLIWKNKGIRGFWLFLGCMLLGIFIADQLSSSIFKPLFQRPRPTQDPIIMYLVDTVHNYRGGRYGFFSGHACNTFTVATLLCFLIRRRWLNCIVVSWALLNCYTRLYLGVHYFGDITVGTCFGLLIGYLMYRLYAWKAPKIGISASTFLDLRSSYILAVSVIGSYCLIFLAALCWWL